MPWIIKRTKPAKFNMMYWTSTFQWGDGWVENQHLATLYATQAEADAVSRSIDNVRGIRTVVIELPGP